MKYIIPIIILSLVLLSCAKKDDTPATTTTALEGTLIVSCYDDGSNNYLIKTLTVTGTDWVDKYEIHSDSSCATDKDKWETTAGSLSIGDEVTYSSYVTSGGSGHEFTMTLITNKYTPQTSELISWTNTNSWCGETDWELNTAQDVAGKTCGSSTRWSSGITGYGLYKLVDGSTLYWCVDDEGHPNSCSTSSSNTFIKQQNLILSQLSVGLTEGNVLT